MSNSIMIHLAREKANIKVSDELTSADGNKYRTLDLDYDANIFINNDQLEELFDKIDSKLHKKTYVQLQDEVLCMGIDKENDDEIIQRYRDMEEERCEMRNRRLS